MPIHRIDWRINVSAVEEIGVVKDAIKWLFGPKCKFEIEMMTSFHGSKFHSIHGSIDTTANAKKTLARLGPSVLSYMIENIDSRLDDRNFYHLRLDYKSLISGKVNILGIHGDTSVKLKMKIKVFPNENPIDKCRKLFENMIERV